MSLDIVWTWFARDQLGENMAFLADTNPARAEATLERILTRVDQLADAPWSAPPSRAVDDPTFRRLVVDSHVVIYRIAEPESRLYILSVRHGSQRPVRPEEIP
jgi:plasmid stabilization system protein ParE